MGFDLCPQRNKNSIVTRCSDLSKALGFYPYRGDVYL
ncbi:unnamed protein product [Arabidopsis thaliana]|uniref:Uncharacterized protein n=4 Tax=Arabidopsis TaxID=3701 RepID=A0A654EJJ9_ARATH|nr:uncharacterized protein AT1G53541 [Arabidopsis thaliana]KAG7649505.1 hypothetical protein ISN45_At01g045580 [Arabidopsis thaliana x Arabidopsis arenosa]KAG7657383.1 hypothetical protein ISN44_As01g044580 [Arabidopsis suecica]AEE32955.1 hypothetical protein AT1G53541 [Arabidopsis thaliana]CAA0292175.1 unnamed protein product [Arabidopsis thaliana]VYS48995.1 unnamed protein product [Arabidopsis thaliana]|eukprot:NP_001117481.1 hypothetical protein AT1G53541 [Arabidopsis thaliana]